MENKKNMKAKKTSLENENTPSCFGAVMRCFDCEFIRKMKSGKDWCVNDKSWMVGWIPDIQSQGCKFHVVRK